MAASPPTPGRIAVGQCTSCGHVLRMKPHAVNSVVNLTCKCGAQNRIAIAADVLKSVAVASARQDRKPAPFRPPPQEDPPHVQLIRLAAAKLLVIYRSRATGFLPSNNGPLEQEIRQIGRALNETGGFELMLMAHAEVQRQCDVLGGPRNLEFMWDGIGRWQG